MSTMTDDTTVTFQTGDGEPVGPFTTDEIERTAEGLRPKRQLTFDVGSAGGEPDFASLKIAGSFTVWKDLKRRSFVHVTVTDHFGEMVCEADGTISGVMFKDKEDQHGNISTERIHTAQLG